MSQGDRGKGASGTGAYGVVEDIAAFETRNMQPACYERVTPYAAQKDKDGHSLVIEGLKKTFPSGTTAVDGINLKLFSD